MARASASSSGNRCGESYLARRFRSISLSKAFRIAVEKYVVIFDLAGSYVAAARHTARYATLSASMLRNCFRSVGYRHRKAMIAFGTTSNACSASCFWLSDSRMQPLWHTARALDTRCSILQNATACVSRKAKATAPVPSSPRRCRAALRLGAARRQPHRRRRARRRLAAGLCSLLPNSA